MREIVFRGIPKDDTVRHFFADIWKENCEGSFVYGSLVVAHDRYYICVSAMCSINSCINNGMTSMIEVIPSSVSEFTGLCDKNGKKIFEGDIFKPFDNEIIVVAWIDYYSTLGFLCRVEHTETKRGKEITESYDGWAMLCDYELSNLEIIGNIHDNPELLKGGVE